MSWLRKDRDKTEHGYVAERLSAYLDGQLTPQEQTAVDQHVATCEVCRWDLATLRQTVQWTRELPPVSVPRVFTVPVEAEPGRPVRRWRLVPALQGATALVALLLFFVVAGDVVFRSAMPDLAPAREGMLEQQAVEVRTTQVVRVEKEMEEPLAADDAVAEKAIVAPEAVPLPEEVAPTGAMREIPAEAAVEEAPKAPGEDLEAVASEPQAEAAGEGESGAPPEGGTEESQAEVEAEMIVAEAEVVILTATLTVSAAEGLWPLPSVPAPTLRFGTERAAATATPQPTIVVVTSTPDAQATSPATPTPLPTATVALPPPPNTPVQPASVPTEAPQKSAATDVAAATTIATATVVAAVPTPVPQPTMAPTIVVGVLDPVEEVDQSWPQEPPGARRRPDIDPVLVLEVGLGIMLVLLAAATILLMVERRRA